MRRSLILLPLLALVALTLASCGGDVSKDILGEWKGDGIKQDIEFSEDGTVLMKGHEHSTYEGTYTLVGNELTCTFLKLSQPVVMTVKISGSKMVLTAKSGREERYRR